jgi:hypothetical protein
VFHPGFTNAAGGKRRISVSKGQFSLSDMVFPMPYVMTSANYLTLGVDKNEGLGDNR